VPWLKPGQRGYSEADLPTDVLKRNLYEIGREKLKSAGYADIGMDHFALPHDSLFKAHMRGELHRNFMGYTTTNTELLVGLGTSAISDAKYAYAQNVKKVEDYLTLLKDNNSIIKGHILSEEDLLLKEAILEISCMGKLRPELMRQVSDPNIVEALVAMEREGLLHIDEASGLNVTMAGRPFIRNICRVFDKRMAKGNQDSSKPLYSKAI
jgi:oxygen-independent coproporphyrinogen-3 oxidase